MSTIPSVSQGWGGQLLIIKGGEVQALNRALHHNDSDKIDGTNHIADADRTSTADFLRYNFGGRNTYLPYGYANHKPVAFGTFNGKSRLFQILHDNRSLQKIYISAFDGSGLFANNGPDQITAPWRAGRGSDLLSPSGLTHDVGADDHCLIRFDNQVYGYGHHIDTDENSGASAWNNKFGWDFSFDFAELGAPTKRTFRVIKFSEDGQKVMGPVRSVEGNTLALSRFHLGGCDAISFRNDIYFADWVEVLKFPNASGDPVVMYADVNSPLAKSFSVWPSGGFNVSTGARQGDNNLLILESNGSLYRLNAPGSGRNLLVDLTDVRANSSNRETDNVFARINSSTLEPGRPPLLMEFNKELHAFFVTATSGYQHFTCATSPSGTGNWVDRTDSLPPQLRANDGCLYGYIDDNRGWINFLHVAYSKFGLWGMTGGGQNSGGGFWLYRHATNRNWVEVTSSVVGLPPRGLIPYQGQGPWASIPSGINPEVFRCQDYTIVTYKLYDQFGRNVNVDIEFSIDDGLTWTDARRFKSYDTAILLGSGISNLPTSPSGVQYEFFWDHVNSVGFDTVEKTLLRITPKLVN